MKRIHTEKKSANRGPNITAKGIEAMNVRDRRKQGIKTFDSDEYDRKHGIVGNGAGITVSDQKQRRANSRRTQ